MLLLHWKSKKKKDHNDHTLVVQFLTRKPTKIDGLLFIFLDCEDTSLMLRFCSWSRLLLKQGEQEQSELSVVKN